MKLTSHPDTDSLYIDLAERASVESHEITTGIVLDYDEDGNLVGIDIDNASSDNASSKVQLNEVIVRGPGRGPSERAG